MDRIQLAIILVHLSVAEQKTEQQASSSGTGESWYPGLPLRELRAGVVVVV